MASPAVQLAIHNRIASRRGQLYHGAAVAVPRAVARLFRRRPDLIATACRFFVDQTQQQSSLPLLQPDYASVLFDNINQDEKEDGNDWVWTTLPFGRTPYAMLRTVMSRRDWTSAKAIPASYAH